MQLEKFDLKLSTAFKNLSYTKKTKTKTNQNTWQGEDNT